MYNRRGGLQSIIGLALNLLVKSDLLGTLKV